jgi:hypothetical protein
MTLHPKHRMDLMLAPVAAEVDLNLQRIRDVSPRDVEAQLELELDTPAMHLPRAERAELIRRQAIRNVELHGWTVTMTEDGTRLHVAGGSVSLDLGLSAGITRYVEEGVDAFSRRGAA